MDYKVLEEEGPWPLTGAGSRWSARIEVSRKLDEAELRVVLGVAANDLLSKKTVETGKKPAAVKVFAIYPGDDLESGSAGAATLAPFGDWTGAQRSHTAEDWATEIEIFTVHPPKINPCSPGDKLKTANKEVYLSLQAASWDKDLVALPPETDVVVLDVQRDTFREHQSFRIQVEAGPESGWLHHWDLQLGPPFTDASL